MNIIYPKLFNHGIISDYIVRHLDEYRMEIIDTDNESIDEFEPHCNVYLLQYEEYFNFPHPILVHEFYENVENFVEINNEFEFFAEGYEFTIPKHGEPIFCKTILTK